MNDDDLRAELAGADPALPAHEPVDRRQAAELLERIMNAPVTPADLTATPARPRARLAWAAGAALVVIAGVLALTLRDGSTGNPSKTPTRLALALPSGTSITSCMPFSVDVLKGMSPAFAGTVSALTEGEVTITVDHWYSGGKADEVTLSQTAGGTAATSVAGITFEQGNRYFVTAANGTVNGCGYTGPATADLQRSFEAAFPS